jgi:hypothetical protein
MYLNRCKAEAPCTDGRLGVCLERPVWIAESGDRCGERQGRRQRHWIESDRSSHGGGGRCRAGRRLRDRLEGPVRQGRLFLIPPMDLESRKHRQDDSRARDPMFATTDADRAPWLMAGSGEKKRARLDNIRHLPSRSPCDPLPKTKIGPSDHGTRNAYDGGAGVAAWRSITEGGRPRLGVVNKRCRARRNGR